jgi:hypothetical protein
MPICRASNILNIFRFYPGANPGTIFRHWQAVVVAFLFLPVKLFSGVVFPVRIISNVSKTKE